MEVKRKNRGNKEKNVEKMMPRKEMESKRDCSFQTKERTKEKE